MKINKIIFNLNNEKSFEEVISSDKRLDGLQEKAYDNCSGKDKENIKNFYKLPKNKKVEIIKAFVSKFPLNRYGAFVLDFGNNTVNATNNIIDDVVEDGYYDDNEAWIKTQKSSKNGGIINPDTGFICFKYKERTGTKIKGWSSTYDYGDWDDMSESFFIVGVNAKTESYYN